MPEMRFHVRWPDGERQSCYSPSLVVAEHLETGTAYAVPDFLARSTAALQIASERVRAKFGQPCSLALGQLADLETRAGRFAPADLVHVERFEQ